MNLPALRKAAQKPVVLVWAVHAALFAASGVLAFLLRFEFHLEPRFWAHALFALPIWIGVKLAVFSVARLDRDAWGLGSIPDVLRIGVANVSASALCAAILMTWGPAGFPRSIHLLDLSLSLHATAGLRVLARAVREASGRRRGGGPARSVVIYGAGAAGAALLRELRANPAVGYAATGFIDDDPAKRGTRVQLVPVLGCGSELGAVAARYRIEEVLIAMPSVRGPALAPVLERCTQAGLRCKTVPGMGEMIQGAGLARQIRDVAVEDLLCRTPVVLEDRAIAESLRGAVVLVSGAAGSIGSELCRQIARFQPAGIVGFDAAETPLFHLQMEMREGWPGVSFHAEIGSVQNRARLAELFGRYRPAAVFHAAAYKHVPMMESHLVEAVENNVLGTYRLARAAARHGVRRFVMISSDKAVRPASIMGLTKRVAELIVAALQDGRTRFVSVRFGNVLGSNGSVVPIFKKQIAAGGPLTVTHAAMRRYFMTIPEAAQLVLQASTMGRGGEIFVLDMAEPVRIVDLARNLILLSGLRPGRDVEIRYTGVRPGEKISEELSAYNENTAATGHQKVRMLVGSTPPARVLARVPAIAALCRQRDPAGLIRELAALVPEYTPSDSIRALLDYRSDLLRLGQAVAGTEPGVARTVGVPAS